MNTKANPYAPDLAGRDPVASLRETTGLIERTARAFDAAAWERRYAPGKWTGRQLMVHLAQCEAILGTRVRFPLEKPGFTIEPFDQDVFVGLEPAVDGPLALASFLAQRRVHLQLFAGLSAAALATPLVHPERGPMTVQVVIETLAGHDWHHLPQLQIIGQV